MTRRSRSVLAGSRWRAPSERATVSGVRTAQVASVVLAAWTTGCGTAYELHVKDPSDVEVRDQLTGTVIVPKGAPTAAPPAPTSGTRRLVRRLDGSLVLVCPACSSDDVVLSADGSTDARLRSFRLGEDVTLDTTLVHGGKYRSQISVDLVTPRSNVRDLREREPYNELAGYTFVANGALWFALASVFFFVPGLTVGKGSERRPMTGNERAWIGGAATFIGVGFTVGGGALLVRGNPSKSVLGPGTEER